MEDQTEKSCGLGKVKQKACDGDKGWNLEGLVFLQQQESAPDDSPFALLNQFLVSVVSITWEWLHFYQDCLLKMFHFFLLPITESE